MALFGKNTQGQALKNNNAQEPAENVKLDNQTEEITLEQLEKTISNSVEKIKLFNQKNQQHINLQKNKLELLREQLQTLEAQKNNNIAGINNGSVKGFELELLRKRMADLTDQLANKRLEIEQIELDITILERTRDEESIKALLHAYETYENVMFNQFITPLETEITAAKAFYFEKLKQLRNKYNMLEGLTVHINSISIGNQNINLYNWVNAIHSKPQLLITKDDDIQELKITTTYRAQ